MLKAKHYSADGTEKGEVTLPEATFGVKPNPHLVWEAVKAYQASQRQGTAATKTRSFVRGGGRKPWKQKGTGRARQGSIRSAQWKGGYTVFGPQPRDYSRRLPRRMRQFALKSLLSDRAQSGSIAVVDELNMTAPRTKAVADMLTAMGMAGRKVCVVTQGSQPNVYKSFRNLPRVSTLSHSAMNVYDLANADVVIFTEGALSGITEVYGS